MKKSLIILWLLGILVLCFPLSYVTNVVSNTYMPADDFQILVIVCTFGGFIFLGLIAWLIYYILKRRKHSKPAKLALTIFTLLVVAVPAVSSTEFAKKNKRRQAYLYMRVFETSFIKSCVDKGKSTMKPLMAESGIDSLDQKIEGYCRCSFDKMEFDDEIKDKIMDESVPMDEVMRDPKVVKMATDCATDFFK